MYALREGGQKDVHTDMHMQFHTFKLDYSQYKDQERNSETTRQAKLKEILFR